MSTALVSTAFVRETMVSRDGSRAQLTLDATSVPVTLLTFAVILTGSVLPFARDTVALSRESPVTMFSTGAPRTFIDTWLLISG